MPYTSVYVDDGKGVLRTGSGVLTGLELISCAIQLGRDDEHARHLHYGLVDFSAVTEMKVTPEDIRQLVEMSRKTAVVTPGALVAVIAPDPLPYAIARLWHTFAEDLGWKTNVFHTRADALAWLRKELLYRRGANTDLNQYPTLQQSA